MGDAVRVDAVWEFNPHPHCLLVSVGMLLQNQKHANAQRIHEVEHASFTLHGHVCF